MLAGCAAPGLAPEDATPSASEIETSRLFGSAYSRVMHYYLEPKTAEDAALPVLRRLDSLAPEMALAVEHGVVVLRADGAIVGRYAAPQPTDAIGWGKLTATVLQQARLSSPILAAMSQDQLERAMFAGLTDSLDRFSHYLPPDIARQERSNREGFVGIGIRLDLRHPDELRVSEVVPGSPAERAGFRVDDRIVEIEGKPTAAMPPEEVASRLRGPAGSQVAIGLRRPGIPEPLIVSPTRSLVPTPTVVARHEGGVVILRVTGFHQHTADTIREAFTTIRGEMHDKPRGVILDLRDNPGGLFDQGIAVANLFMSGGRISVVVGRNPSDVLTFDATGDDITRGAPMAVLVNGGAASAAEIVAAALQDSGRAVSVGSSSYGKGTVQAVLPLPNGGELTLTLARLIAPAGYMLDEHGIVPALCTGGIADDTPQLADILLRRGTAVAELRRSTLNDADWSRLRQSCPGETGNRRVEVAAAMQVLSTPDLYSRIIRAEADATAGQSSPAPKMP